MQNDNIGSEAGRADAPAGRLIPLDPDALLFQSEAAYLIGCSGRTLEAWRLHGGGPPFIQLGRRAVRYRRRDLLGWIEARRRRSTSDPGPALPPGGRPMTGAICDKCQLARRSAKSFTTQELEILLTRTGLIVGWRDGEPIIAALLLPRCGVQHFAGMPAPAFVFWDRPAFRCPWADADAPPAS